MMQNQTSNNQIDANHYDAIVIGSGIMGSSSAYHLAKAGLKVLVLEKYFSPIQSRVAPASTLRATGGFRVQYGSEINVRLSLMAREVLRNFEAEFEIDSGYNPCGYLFIAETENDLEQLRQAMQTQRKAGMDRTKELKPQEVQDINPALNIEGVVGATFCDWDGFIKPANILSGYTKAATRLGVKYIYSADARLQIKNQKVFGVQTQTDCFASQIIVNAAGAWAGELMRQAGLELPVQPERRQIASTVPTNVLPENMPMSIFVSDGFHVRVRDARVMLLKPTNLKTEDPFDLSFDKKWLQAVLPRARTCLPILNNIELDPEYCWAGLYEQSPDHHAILGESLEISGLFFINGSSGHGNMHAPALSKLLSEIILYGESRSLNTKVLRPSRFKENDLVKGLGLL